MFRIGLFARICQVSVPTLRHYDEVGLLAPAEVDPATSYRYYSIDQLPRVHRIVALKNLGLSLDEIKEVLEEQLSLQELQGMLRLKKAEMHRNLTEIGASIRQVEDRLKFIEREGQMPDYEIVTKETDTMLVASKQVVASSRDEVPELLNAAFAAVGEFVNGSPAELAGPAIALWHAQEDKSDGQIIEAIFPIDKAVDESQDIKIYKLPGELVAAAVHTGEFSHFMEAFTAVHGWIEKSDYEYNGHLRELYHKFDPMDLSDTTVEVQVPVKRR